MSMISKISLIDNYSKTAQGVEKSAKSMTSALTETKTKTTGLSRSLDGLKKKQVNLRIKDIGSKKVQKNLNDLNSKLRKLPVKGFNVRVTYKESNKDWIKRLKSVPKEKITNIKTTFKGLREGRSQLKEILKGLKGTTRKGYKINITMPNGKSILENIKAMGKGAGGLAKGALAMGGKALLAGGAAAATAGVAGATTMWKQGSELQSYDISMQHFLGGNKGKSDNYMKQLKTEANLTPFSTSEVIAAGTRAVQVTGGDTAKGMQLTKMAEDMAALTPGKSISDAMEALADMQMGEMERMKEFGFKGSKADLDKAGGDLFAAKDQVTGKTIKDLFAGGAGKLSDSAEGKKSTIEGNLQTGVAEAGVKMLDRMKPLLDNLVPISEKIGEGLPQIVDTLMDKLSPLGDTLSTVFGSIGDVVQPLLPAFSALGSAVIPLFQAGLQLVGGFITSIVGPALSMLGSLITGLAVPAMNVATGVIQGVVIPVMKAIGTVISSTVVPVFDRIASLVGGAVTAAFKAVKSAVNRVKSAFESVKEAVGSLRDKISGAWAKFTSFGSAPANASGTSYFEGGITRVNEMGQEMMQLPKGTKIYPHGKTTQLIQKEITSTDKSDRSSRVVYYQPKVTIYEAKNSKQTAEDVERKLRQLAVTV